MPEKINRFRTYGDKLISLFARLLFSGESYSLTQLARMLDCSKPTVLRLVSDIRMAYGVTIEETMKGNRKYFRIRKPARRSLSVTLSREELQVLQMCRSFTENLLGRRGFDEATRAVTKSAVLADPDTDLPNDRHFGVFRPGSIDYTPYHEIIRTLIESMDEKVVCKASYRKITAESLKIYYIKPLKIFSHHDTVYLSARLAQTPGERYREPEYDPLLAIHRFQDVVKTDRKFEVPDSYDFDKIYNRAFGIMNGPPFEVEVEFSGKPAAYVAERSWSPDQRITRLDNGGVRLLFSASSKPELLPWVLAFGPEARVIRPEWLIEEVRNAAEGLLANY